MVINLFSYAIIQLPLAIVLSRTFVVHLKWDLRKSCGWRRYYDIERKKKDHKVIEGAIKDIIDVGCKFIHIFRESQIV